MIKIVKLLCPAILLICSSLTFGAENNKKETLDYENLPTTYTVNKRTNQETWLNDLNCNEFTSEKTCQEMEIALKDLKLNNYEKMTFDNQLKKIAILIRKDKEKIAIKRYDYFLKSFSSVLDDDSWAKVKENKSGIWDLIKNYSLSDQYQADPKYKI